MITIFRNIIGKATVGAVKGALGSVLPERKKENETMKQVISAVIRWILAVAGGGILGDTVSQEDLSQLQSAVQTILGGLAVAVPIIWSIVEKIRAKKA
jgi:hypothetical protein